jgi:hypothetical protein
MNPQTNSTPDDGQGGALIHLGAGQETPAPINVTVEGMTTKVKKITTTDEGKLQVVLESEGMDDNTIGHVKTMLTLQQTCLVQVSMVPVQRDLFDA